MKKLRVCAKVAKPTRQRLKGGDYWFTIKKIKWMLDLPYSTIAGWMGITTSNLTSMISQCLNPYPEQWKAFSEGLRNYRTQVQVWIDPSQTIVCRRAGCNIREAKTSWNKKDCRFHRRKSFKKYPL